MLKTLFDSLIGAVMGGLVVWGLSSGLYLMSLTTYPYWNIVGGAVLIGAVIGGLIGLVPTEDM